MLTIVVNLLDAAQRSGGSLVAGNQAKVALDFIAQDLQSAVMRPDGNVWLAATIQGNQSGEGDSGAEMATWGPSPAGIGVVKPRNEDEETPSLNLNPTSEQLEDYRFGMAGVWLRLFAIPPDNTRDSFDEDEDGDTEEILAENVSAIRAIAYQIIRYRVSEAAGSSIRYGLFRSSVRPFHHDPEPASQSVFAVGYDLFAQPSDKVHYNNPDFNPGSNPNSHVGDAGAIRRPRRDFIIANNVVDFGVRFRRTGEPEPVFPSSQTNLGFAATTDHTAVPVNPALASASMSYDFPDSAEIFLRVLSDEGAKQLEMLEQGKFGDTEWWDLVEANSQVFTRRVELKGSVF
ncbi:MAG: hypothetical protein ACREIA_11555 [Opitutaceae bacterium]